MYLQPINRVIIALAAVALLVVAAAVYTNLNYFKDLLNISSKSSQTTETIEGGALVVENQSINKEVNIKKVTVSDSAGGFVTVAKLKTDGSVESTIAISSFLEKGSYENIKATMVSASTTVKAGDVLLAQLVIDSDGNGTFSDKDKPSSANITITVK